jgi:hypothetical protein
VPFRGVSYHHVAQMQKYVSKEPSGINFEVQSGRNLVEMLTNGDILNFDLCDLQKYVKLKTWVYVMYTY